MFDKWMKAVSRKYVIPSKKFSLVLQAFPAVGFRNKENNDNGDESTVASFIMHQLQQLLPRANTDAASVV
jgi:hypothetical protein